MSAHEPLDHETGDLPQAGLADARFHRRVRELVAFVGPADALAPARAEAAAAVVLCQTIVRAHNRRMLGDELEPRVADLRTIGEAMRRTIDVIAGRVIVAEREGIRDAAARVARASLAIARRAEWLDTDEIPWLVALAYGVGLEVQRRDPDLAGRLVLAADAG